MAEGKDYEVVLTEEEDQIKGMIKYMRGGMVRERVGIVFLWLLPCNCTPKYRNRPMNGNANLYAAQECDYAVNEDLQMDDSFRGLYSSV